MFEHIRAFVLLCIVVPFSARGFSVSDSLEQRILNAKAQGRVVDQLSNSFSQKPGGEFLLAPANKDLNLGVLIYNIDILPDRAVFSAGMAFRDPKSNQLIAFRADQISFSHKNGLTGPVRLYMVSDINITMGKAAEILIRSGSENTYAVFECSGFSEFGISGQVDFNSEFILPVNGAGEVMPEKKLSSLFTLKAKTWSDMVVSISIQPFQVKGFNDYVFTISNAVMDLSETMNVSNMVFPDAYLHSEVIGDYSEESGDRSAFWEGFYLEKGSVTLPGHFRSSSKQRIELGVTDLLIDEFGFSGRIFGTNLLNFEKGRIANWNFSIDKMEISIVMNEIVGGMMAGDLGMPILPDTSRLGYIGYISTNDNYGMEVSLRNQLNVPAFKVAKMVLDKNSYVNMSIVDGELRLLAELNGEFMIENKGSNSGEGVKFKFPSVAFQGFSVANTTLHIDIEYLGLKTTNSTSGFSGYPLNINEIFLQKSGTEKRIGIRFGLNLMEKLSVKAGVSIVADEQDEKLKFKRLDINEVEVRSVTSCFTLEGRIYFIKEDPDYGNGFSGTIRFVIDKPKIEANASVLFGNVNSHRYWYFDASVVWEKPGIPFFTGAEINGFLGGAWHGMREATEKDNIKNPQYGLTSIGKHYVPDVRSGLGLRAGVYIRSTGGSGSSSPFLAKVALELQFNSNNGLNKISIFGNIDVMTENNKTDKADLKRSTANVPGGNAWKSYQANYQPLGKIGGPFMLEFDFANKVYQSNFAIYLQGIADNKIVGIGNRGLAGEVSIYFSPSKWYFWVGTPQQPIGIRLDMGNSGSIMASAYFMAGKDVQPAEPLPREITDILGSRNADEMRKLSEMASGNAFAFGSRIYLQLGSSGGEKNVSIYASLKAIIGFDINVANYGNNTYCEGRSGPPGINGWFANGQLFTYLQGKVGASYKVKGISGKVDLLTLTCAAQLYCQGPNPFYSNGSAAIQVSIAGVIDKEMKLQFEIGEQCTMTRKRYSDTVLILATSPVNGENSINPLAELKTEFSVPIEKLFTDVEGRRMKFSLVRYEASDNAFIIPGKIQWNDAGDKLVFYPEKALPGNKKIKLLIHVRADVLNTAFDVKNADGTISRVALSDKASDKIRYRTAVEKMIKDDLKSMDFGNGMKMVRREWYEPVFLNGQKVDEIKEVYFNTSASPNKIIENNVVSAYPVPKQMNYHKNISIAGFIRLRVSQDDLANVPESKIMALLVDKTGVIVTESKVTVNGKLWQYRLQNNAVINNAVYSLVFKRVHLNAPSAVGQKLDQYGNSSGVNIAKNSESGFVGYGTVTGSLQSKPVFAETELFSYSFGSSAYPGLQEKIQDCSLKGGSVSNEGWVESKMTNRAGEYFDYFELVKCDGMKPLLQMELKLDQVPWYVNNGKKVYAIYNTKDADLLKVIQLERDTTAYGFIPSRAIRLTETGLDKMFIPGKGAVNGMTKPVFLDKELIIENNFYETMTNDLEEIKKGLVKYVTSGNRINEVELNRYLAALNSRNNFNGSVSEAGKGPGGAYSAMQGAGMNVSSLSMAFVNLNNPASNTAVKGSIGQGSQWVLKISKLKINAPSTEENYPVCFYYRIPPEIKPVSTCILKPGK